MDAKETVTEQAVSQSDRESEKVGGRESVKDLHDGAHVGYIDWTLDTERDAQHSEQRHWQFRLASRLHLAT